MKQKGKRKAKETGRLRKVEKFSEALHDTMLGRAARRGWEEALLYNTTNYFD